MFVYEITVEKYLNKAPRTPFETVHKKQTYIQSSFTFNIEIREQH